MMGVTPKNINYSEITPEIRRLAELCAQNLSLIHIFLALCTVTISSYDAKGKLSRKNSRKAGGARP